MRDLKYDRGKAPIVRCCLRQFPDALEAIAFVSAYGLEKYEVESEDQAWRKVLNGDKRYLDADGRHLIRDGYDDESGYLHAAHHLWCAAATLQLLLESGQPLVDPVRGKGPHRIINKTEGEESDNSSNVSTGKRAGSDRLDDESQSPLQSYPNFIGTPRL